MRAILWCGLVLAVWVTAASAADTAELLKTIKAVGPEAKGNHAYAAGKWTLKDVILHIADEAPEAGLIPVAKDPARPIFLRWLEFIVAAIYPTYTYGDDPRRWTGDEAAAKQLRQATDEHRKELWRYFVSQNPCRPWVLGETFSALDLYVAVMNLWRPGPDWFKKKCPALADIAARVSKLDALGVVWARNVD